MFVDFNGQYISRAHVVSAKRVDAEVKAPKRIGILLQVVDNQAYLEFWYASKEERDIKFKELVDK